MRTPTLRYVITIGLLARAVGAQTVSGNAISDSAAAARRAWGRAGDALEKHDLAGARREVERAAAAWPSQPSYHWTSAVLAARAADTSAAIAALQRYAGLGLGRDLMSDTTLARLVELPAMQAIRRAFDANRRPLVRSRTFAVLPDSAFWPEGMDVDEATRRIFVASIRYGTIAELSPQGSVREIMPRNMAGMGALFGVRYDRRVGMLWATASGTPNTAGYQPADSAIAALLQIRPSDGTVMKRFDLPPVTGGHVLGDLAIGPHGDVFLTDSNEPVFYRLRPGSDRLEPLRHPLFHNLQGIAPAPDGRTVVVSDYSHGLLRLDLSSGAVTRIADVKGSTSLGCDGIVWFRQGIIAVQNGVTPPRVMRFDLDRSLTRIVSSRVLDRNLAVADEPTIGAMLGRTFLYVANGQWDKHGLDGSVLSGAHLVRPIILAAPVP